MPRMLGRYRTAGCWSGTESDHRTHPDGGPDCSGHERDTRARKRLEARTWPAAGLGDLTGEWHDAQPGSPAASVPLHEHLGMTWDEYAGWVRGECRHGCNGTEVIHGHASGACDWQCHPGLTLDPARFDALMNRPQAG